LLELVLELGCYPILSSGLLRPDGEPLRERSKWYIWATFIEIHGDGFRLMVVVGAVAEDKKC
jgi:hypothetical protein